MNYLLTLLVAIVGGIAMSLLHAPLPWTLGPITAVSLCSLLLRRRFRWPLGVRNTALIVGADISTMTAYQLTRLLFIMLAFPYIAKAIVRCSQRPRRG